MTVPDADLSQPHPDRSHEQLLLEFLRGHNVECPTCGYNLRALTRPVCPECGLALRLTVGTARVRTLWLFVAIAPGFFSGIAAVLVLAMICAHLYFTGTTWTIIVLMDIFGWTSGAAAVLLAWKRDRFLMLPAHRQCLIATGVWITHVLALPCFLLLGHVLNP